MARQRARAREHHGPGHVGRARPHSSPLMKLAMRPRNRPIGAGRAGQVAERQERRCRASARSSTTASTQPMKPPWNDMPPFQSCTISERVLAGNAGGCRTAHSRVRPPRMMPSVTHSTKSSKSMTVSGAGPPQQRSSLDQHRGHRPSRAGCRRYRPARTSGWRTARS